MFSLFNFRNPFTLTPEGRRFICERFHRRHHEKYYECQGDYGGYLGEVWEGGIRCKKCGRKWADPELIEAENKRWAAEQARYWHCQFGTADRIIMSLTGTWDQGRTLEEAYETVKTVFADKAEPEYIGPIDDKFFVFLDSCGRCNVKVVRDGWSSDYRDEWNLLSNFPGLSTPMHPEARTVWDKLKLDYQSAKRFLAQKR